MPISQLPVILSAGSPSSPSTPPPPFISLRKIERRLNRKTYKQVVN